MDSLADAAWALSALKKLLAEVDDLLAPRPSSAGTMQLIAATTRLKNEMKTANASGRYEGRKIPNEGPARLLSWAIMRAAADFRMRADTDPSRGEWRRTLSQVREHFSDYIDRIRKECPEVG